MPEVHTETEWLHDTVPSWVKWRLSLGASAGRRDSIHGPIHSFARTEKTRHCLVYACRRAANTPTRVAAFEEGQRISSDASSAPAAAMMGSAIFAPSIRTWPRLKTPVPPSENRVVARR